MAGLAAAFFVVKMWHRDQTGNARQINRWLLASAILFLGGVLAIYVVVGHPPTIAAVSVIPPNHVASPMNDAAAGSIDEATHRLAAKLAKGEGSDADWQLLQQSYDFMGNSAAAALAAQHKLPDAETGATVESAPVMQATAQPSDIGKAVATDAAMYEKLVAANPQDAAAWRALAERYRTARQLPKANAAFTQLIKLKAMDADAWADYADAVASQQGSLSNAQTRNALQAALAIDAKHPKALWLQASLLLEEKRYAAALTSWRQLRSVIGDNSPDAKIIDANIAEAESLAGSRAMPSVSVANNSAASPASNGAARVQGSVNIDAALQGKLAGAMLFVFAKAADSPAPVAVYRTAIAAWPVSFTLDDSQAMMPGRQLSNYAQVLIQARVSQNGQAIAQAGDWESEALTVSTQNGKPITLLIKRPVIAKAGS